jgi:hypothetical protein
MYILCSSILLQSDWGSQRESDGSTCQTDPNCKRVITDLFRREALGVCRLGVSRERDRNKRGALIAVGSERDGRDLRVGVAVGETITALISCHTSDELGICVGLLERDDGPVDEASELCDLGLYPGLKHRELRGNTIDCRVGDIDLT